MSATYAPMYASASPPISSKEQQLLLRKPIEVNTARLQVFSFISPPLGKPSASSRKQTSPTNPSQTRLHRQRKLASKMSSPTFPRFGELPSELQMQIWKYAAAPEGNLELSDWITCSIPLGRQLSSIDLQKDFFRKTTHGSDTYPAAWRKIESTCQTRNALRQACQLSRLMALEIWKMEMEAMKMTCSFKVDVFGRMKVETVKMLAGLIAQLKAPVPVPVRAQAKRVPPPPGKYWSQILRPQRAVRPSYKE